jgi:tetratricopeptide (TPR) repeat protein
LTTALTADHPTPDSFDRLLAGTLADPEQRWATVAHLVGRCEVCARYLRAAMERPPAGRPQSARTPQDREQPDLADYDAVFARSLERSAEGAAVIRADELAASACWTTLEGTPPGQRLRLVRADPRFHRWALAARLLEAAGEFQWIETDGALLACRLALAIAERLAPAGYPAGLTGDLRARALGTLADMLRLDGRLADARKTMQRAWDALDQGTGDPLERAALLRLAANLELALGDGGAAVALLRPAAATYRVYGDRHQQGRTLQKLALAIGFDDPAEGAALAERALVLIDPGREPRLDLAARHALIWFLNDAGLGWQALDLFERSRPLYRQLGDSDSLLMMPWLEARICRSLGELAAAERGLAAIWHRFRAAGLRQELALVSLDLAETYLALGKSRHALRLLTSMGGTLRRWRMHAEGMAAWLLLIEAAAGEAGKAQALARAASLYFRRAWRRAAPFRP